jgi:hypothetical protein
VEDSSLRSTPIEKGVRLMAMNGLGVIVLAALGICVLAVTLALLLLTIFSSAPMIEFFEWLKKPPDMPCACGPTFTN